MTPEYVFWFLVKYTVAVFGGTIIGLGTVALIAIVIVAILREL